MKRRVPSVYALSSKAMRIGWDAQQVIGLRMMKAAMGGPDAAKEAELMVAEKTAAAFEAQTTILTAMMTGAGAFAPARTLARPLTCSLALARARARARARAHT